MGACCLSIHQRGLIGISLWSKRYLLLVSGCKIIKIFILVKASAVDEIRESHERDTHLEFQNAVEMSNELHALNFIVKV